MVPGTIIFNSLYGSCFCFSAVYLDYSNDISYFCLLPRPSKDFLPLLTPRKSTHPSSHTPLTCTLASPDFLVTQHSTLHNKASLIAILKNALFNWSDTWQLHEASLPRLFFSSLFFLTLLAYPICDIQLKPHTNMCACICMYVVCMLIYSTCIYLKYS